MEDTFNDGFTKREMYILKKNWLFKTNAQVCRSLKDWNSIYTILGCNDRCRSALIGVMGVQNNPGPEVLCSGKDSKSVSFDFCKK